jgi:hypothetical protein
MSSKAATFFSAIPGENDPVELLHSYQQKLVASLQVFLCKIEITFKIPLKDLIEKVEKLDSSKRFSPELFSIYIRLHDHYIGQDVHGIFDTLQAFKVMTKLYALERIYSSIHTENWEHHFIEELRNQGKESHVKMLPLVHWREEDFPPLVVLEAEKVMAFLDPDFFWEYETYISSLKLFSGRVIGGVTSPRFFGNIFLRLPYPDEDPLLYYVEQLVHETSHLHLYVLMGEDPLILNEASERYPSPIRTDLRPMSGLFHAAFVLSRILRVFRKWEENEKADGVIEKTAKHFCDACHTIRQHAKLSDQGALIFESLQLCAMDPC